MLMKDINPSKVGENVQQNQTWELDSNVEKLPNFS
jgi:hypothetical protein